VLPDQRGFFGAVITAVLMRIERPPAALPGATLLGDLSDALRYAWRTRTIRHLLLLVRSSALRHRPTRC
jgi:hypothetical protein